MATQLPIRAVGLPWYEASSYEEVKALMKDGDRFARTYAEWEALAKRTEDELRRKGDLTVRAYIRPAEFAAWCRANGQDVDSHGRMAFANWAAFQEHGKTH